ncbi:hypothetical protein LSAT2_018195 [Lamellibrachia satsuma]|nr:hypothetical protein LSAT2_018195 [Lamellibrachia satsuma]
MMKGLLEYITGSSKMAVDLRDAFVFKIVPMLNPDGVIVGNYRCSLAARDLNRNYRHPRKTSFPTIWHTKALMEEFSQEHEILVYCDLHGHSRKHNVFMYGCNRKDTNEDATEAILKERLFPWLMAQKAPEKFLFRGCKFQIKRGKESTGRVVIFRQLRILNSFTMEATFCGTTICKGENRHFNTQDFQHMGQVFSEVALEYNRLSVDEVKRSEVIVDLTRSVVQQVLEKQGLLPATLPDLATEAGIAQLKDLSEGEDTVTSPEQVTTSFMQLVSTELDQRPSDTETTHADDDKGHLCFTNISQMLGAMSADNVSGCVRLLEDLHIKDTVMESDSSDSDSESDAELKFVEPLSKRKKKKHKKNKSCKENSRKQRNDRPNTSSVLPAIDTGDMNSQKRRHNQENNMRNYVKTFHKSFPTFVSKYRGRSNGGIPCFSQERSRERELKRMEEVRKRLETEEHRRELQYKTETVDEMMQSGPLFVHQQQSHISCPQVYHQVGTLPVRLGYMHSEVISPFKVVSAGQARTSDDSSGCGDLVDESLVLPAPFRVHPPQPSNGGGMGRPPLHHLLPLQWPPPKRGIDSHQKHDLQPAESVSIPLRHSKPGIMVTTATMQSDAVPVDRLAASSPGLNQHRPAVTRGRVFGRPQLVQQQQQLQELNSGSAATAARLLSTPMLMSREYTHLLMQSVRTHKNNSSVMPLELPVNQARTVNAYGQRRHSSYD